MLLGRIDKFKIAMDWVAPCLGSPTNLFVGVVSLGDMGPAFTIPSTRITLYEGVSGRWKYGRAKRDTPR